MKQRNRFGIEFILSNDDEKSSFESYCRYKGIKLGLLKQDDWNIILPSIVALRNAHKSHIKAGFDSKLCQIQESSTALHTLQKETK